LACVPKAGNGSAGGYVCTTHHEKMTDVNIAVELLTDAFQDSFDVALLISADGDLWSDQSRKSNACFPESAW
jgi:hypothetical protein